MPHRFYAVGFPLVAVFAGLVISFAFTPQRVIELMGEEGAVERVTAGFFLLLAPLVWLLRRRGDPPATLAALSTVFLAFGARELDWHKIWTGTSVLRVSYFTGPAPMQHKLIALAVLAVFVLALGRLVLRHAPPLLHALRQGEAVAVSVAVFIATLVLAKALDRSYSVLTEDFGLPLSISAQAAVNAIEECLELALGAIALLALWQNRRRPSSSEAP